MLTCLFICFRTGKDIWYQLTQSPHSMNEYTEKLKAIFPMFFNQIQWKRQRQHSNLNRKSFQNLLHKGIKRTLKRELFPRDKGGFPRKKEIWKFVSHPSSWLGFRPHCRRCGCGLLNGGEVLEWSQQDLVHSQQASRKPPPWCRRPKLKTNLWYACETPWDPDHGRASKI